MNGHDSLAKVRVFIPHYYNDSRPVDPALFDFFEAVFLAVAGGWSNPCLLRGACLGPDGDCQLDRNRVYELAIDSEQIPRVRRIVHAIGKLLQQREVYFEIDRSTEMHIEPILASDPVHTMARSIPFSSNGKVAPNELPGEGR